MKIFHTDEFCKNLIKLPSEIKKIYKKQEKIFSISWRDSRLHTKKMRGEKSVFSFRTTRKYRVLFVFIDPNTALFVSMGHRKDIYDKGSSV